MARAAHTKLCALLLATFLMFVAPLAMAQTCGTPGADGGGTITGTVNTYYPPASATQTVSAGSTSISLGSAAAGGGPQIRVGDMVLIIQMQDATINAVNTSRYGANVSGQGNGLTGGTAGTYEFAVATSDVSLGGGTLTLTTGTVNNYYNAPYSGTQGQRTFQVVRVPQYSSVTLGSVTPVAWNGQTGGVVVFDVAGTLALGGGSINVSGKGFRGGGGLQLSGPGDTSAVYLGAATLLSGASKGEGVAGTPRYAYDAASSSVVDTGVDGYPGGSFLRGGPGNAGGGGTDGDPAANDENSGGGGGSNGGDGGKGGFSWSSGKDVGGLGGDAFVSSVTKIVMGGGGGAGSDNNTTGYRSSGAAGGGIVIVRVNAISGAGTISANGSDALDPDQDGGGGGGAGGTVVVATRTGTLSGLTINANGGRGGDTWLSQAAGTNNINEHGPGGGGGGGAIFQTGSATTTVTGGAHGVSTTGSLTFGSVSGTVGKTTTIVATAIPGVAP